MRTALCPKTPQKSVPPPSSSASPRSPARLNRRGSSRAKKLGYARAEFGKYQPAVVVGSSGGRTVAMSISSGDARLVLLCPAWKKWGTARTGTWVHMPRGLRDGIEAKTPVVMLLLLLKEARP
jgi:hypothetical protein